MNLNKNYKSRKKARLRNVEYVNGIKEKNPCRICGETFFPCLQFHHISGKDGNVSQMVHKGFSVKRIKEEIAKCEVLCSNCHIKEHQRMKEEELQSSSSSSSH